jgi:hypothetical protein
MSATPDHPTEAMHALPIPAIESLERLRDSRCVVYCANENSKRSLALNDAAVFYECLRDLGRIKRLDLILNVGGGLMDAARRIALLLWEYTDELNILVPFEARSAGTLLCLSANELILGPMAEFSPLDPIIRVGKESLADSQGVSSEDIRAFRTLAETWFELRSEEKRMQVFALLCQRFSPTTLSSFFRAEQGVRKIGQELLRRSQPASTPAERAKILDQLITGHAEHHQTLTRADIKQLGLKARDASDDEERLLWKILQSTQTYMKTGSDGLFQRVGAVLFSRRFTAHHVTRLSPATEPQTKSLATEPARTPPKFPAAGAWEITA